MSAPRVMVVDDDPEHAAALTLVLEDAGCEVVAAADRRPELILLELSIDGRAKLAELRKDPASAAVPVVLVSARRDLEAVAGELQVAGHLRKPVDLDAVMAVIARIKK